MKCESPNLAPIDETGRKLRRECEHELLRHIIARTRQGDLSPEQLCKCVQAYSELKKQDVAAEKNLVAVEIAHSKRAAPPNAAARRTGAPRHDHAAPFGQKCDGTPYTRDEFRRGLAQSITDIYGLSLPDAATANTVIAPTLPATPVRDRAGTSVRVTSHRRAPDDETVCVTARSRDPP